MRHNKKRNAALLYEFLIRHVSKCLVESRKDEANKAVALLKKYYRSGPLREELDLFNCALNTKVHTAEYASKLLSEVLKRAKRISPKRLDENKTRLIKDINRSFDADSFYAHKIPNYVMYASLQTLLNNETGHKKLHESVNRLQLEEKIVTYLLTDRNEAKSLAESMKLEPQYNNAVYRVVINKFKKKYQEALTESQFRVLSRYAQALISENIAPFRSAVRREVEAAKQKLALVTDPEIGKDKDLMNKISECRTQLHQFDTEKVEEADVVRLLQFMALSDEVTR
jgi:hypothetical protein